MYGVCMEVAWDLRNSPAETIMSSPGGTVIGGELNEGEKKVSGQKKKRWLDFLFILLLYISITFEEKVLYQSTSYLSWVPDLPQVPSRRPFHPTCWMVAPRYNIQPGVGMPVSVRVLILLFVPHLSRESLLNSNHKSSPLELEPTPLSPRPFPLSRCQFAAWRQCGMNMIILHSARGLWLTNFFHFQPDPARPSPPYPRWRWPIDPSRHRQPSRQSLHIEPAHWLWWSQLAL